MEMELKRVTLEGYRSVTQVMFHQEETLESIVPDACPDIALRPHNAFGNFTTMTRMKLNPLSRCG